MNKNIKELLIDTFSDPEHVSPDKLKVLMDGTLGFLSEVKEQLDSEDPKKQAEALNAAAELKQTLESLMESFMKLTGFDLSQMAALTENAQFSPEEKEAIDAIKNGMQQLQKPNEKPAKAKKSSTLRLIG